MTEELRDALLKIKHVALDMDGTIYLSDSIFPFTLDFLDKLGRMGIGYSFLTNNPTRSLEDYLSKLTRMGIRADKQHSPSHNRLYQSELPFGEKAFPARDAINDQSV